MANNNSNGRNAAATQSSQPWGDTLQIPIDETNIIRFYYQNVNGLKLHNECADVNISCQHLYERQATVIGLSETKVEWKHHLATNSVYRALGQTWSHLKWSKSTSEIFFKKAFKPGGTSTIVNGPLSSRVSNKDTDPYGLGRWSSLTIDGRNKRKITAITAYCPPKQTINNAGLFTSFFQQFHQLRSSGSKNPRPIVQFYDDLEQHTITLQAKGNEIVLMMDANESLTDRGSKLKELASACNLTSVHTHLHADLPPPATYSRGSSKIVFILISENLLPACRSCGIEPLHSGIVSDHLALFMDLDQVVALQGPLNTIAPASGRVLQCIKVKFVEKYIEVLDQQLEKQYTIASVSLR
jgi:exonuclease III